MKTVVCKTCGYPVDTLNVNDDGVCPPCAKPVLEEPFFAMKMVRACAECGNKMHHVEQFGVYDYGCLECGHPVDPCEVDHED